MRALWQRWQQVREQRALARRAIPDALWNLTLARFPFLNLADTRDAAELRRLTGLFLDTKEFVGAGGFNDAVGYTRAMSEISLARHPKWTIPALEFAGAPIGIDIRRVAETGIAPAINTGIAHRKAGVGQVGAGVARAPLACFEQALAAFASRIQ